MSDASKPPPRSVRRRVVYIAPGRAGLLAGLVGAPVLLVVGLLRFAALNGSEQMMRSEAQLLGLVVLGGTIASMILAWMGAVVFDIMAPRVGGLEIELVEVPRTELESDGLAECPSCGARVQRGRSFCPECDHDFAAAGGR